MRSLSAENAFPTLSAGADRVGYGLRRMYESQFRKKYVSWTRFREKQLTWRGFKSFDANARCRTYLYLAILVLGLSQMVIAPVLVRIACRAIECASLPRVAWVTTHAEQVFDIQAMRQSIVARYDIDHSGRLDHGELTVLHDQTGLALSDIGVPASKVDYDRLLSACLAGRILRGRITGRVSGCYSMSAHELGRTLRRMNYEKGQQDCAKRHAAMWRDVDAVMSKGWVRPGDYLKLSTWQRGAAMFWYQVVGVRWV